MNARAAHRKCRNARQALDRELAKQPPRQMPSPMGWLFPLVPVVPATKGYVERWEATRQGRVAKLREEADYWCRQERILSAQEAEERRIMAQQLEQMGPAGPGSGRGAGDVALDLLGAGVDVYQGLMAPGAAGAAPASAVAVQRQQQQQRQTAARTRRAAGAVVALAAVGGAGYIGYRYWRSR